jgi:hypothetical protein
MVKIRGHRLQLEEVETALAALPEIAAAAVAVRATARGDQRIVAYVAPRGGGDIDEALVRQALREVLPGYAIPAWFTTVDQLPLTPHGKIDLARLAELDVAKTGEADSGGAAQRGTARPPEATTTRPPPATAPPTRRRRPRSSSPASGPRPPSARSTRVTRFSTSAATP